MSEQQNKITPEKKMSLPSRVGGSFAKTEFSKKIAVIVTIFFILCSVGTGIALLFGKDILQFFDYVASTFNVVLLSYAGKSGVENVFKIAKNSKIADLASKVGITIEEKNSDT